MNFLCKKLEKKKNLDFLTKNDQNQNVKIRGIVN